MYKINITVPLRYNDGSKVQKELLDKIQSNFIRIYGGLTIYESIRGLWEDNGKIYQDKNIILSIVTENKKEELLKSLLKVLKGTLRQEAIFYTITKIQNREVLV